MPIQRFRQFAVLEHLPEASKTYRHGICASLVTQWLAKNGDIKTTSFGGDGATNWAELDDLVCRDMGASRDAAFGFYGLIACETIMLDSREFFPLIAELGKGGLFYLALRNAQSKEAHALGIAVDVASDSWRVFDPNEVVLSLPHEDFVQAFFKILLSYGRNAGLVQWELVPFL